MKLESSSMFYKTEEDPLNGVLDETTANTRGMNSRAHAWLGKFTSGSRPSSSRRPILRSLMSTKERYPLCGSVQTLFLLLKYLSLCLSTLILDLFHLLPLLVKSLRILFLAGYILLSCLILIWRN